MSEVARFMTDAGFVTPVSFISPFSAQRQRARELFEKGEFVEGFVDTPLEICDARDPKGLYKGAHQRSILNFTGIDQPYEAPVDAEVRVDTASRTVSELFDNLIAELTRLGAFADE